ncbi:hypothetical protein SMD11_7009 [Streptomyces albireticuli]|uniref:Glycosyltransferase subfamily 4-like N-terminal domain-containing protein n=1 Tax=Streptomyces albireticuli TaxID=1940 RepID=A0A1Z2LE80_9ACTN|nr:hypothetical protein SMD11_7009 [Streptomyces albireticuli]
MTGRRLRVLAVCATDGFLGPLPLNAAAVRALELNWHLAEGDHRVEVSMLLCDLNPASFTTGWPFPVQYLSPGDYYARDRARMTQLVCEARPDVLVIPDSALLVRAGRQLAAAAGCVLVYEMHGRVPALSRTGGLGGSDNGVVQHAAIRLADAVITLTGRDTRRAIDAGAAGQVRIVPAGAIPQPAAAGGNPQGPVVFAADCTSETNQHALRTLHKQMPEDVPVAVYGRYPAPLGRELPRFTWHGPVSDLHAALITASAGIAPHGEAPGVRAQILAYMTAGLPVIATRKALTGFPHPGSFALISETPDASDLPHLLSVLRQDPTLGRRLGRCGRRLISSELSWARLAARAASAYRDARPRRRDATAPAVARRLAEHPPPALTALHHRSLARDGPRPACSTTLSVFMKRGNGDIPIAHGM